MKLYVLYQAAPLGLHSMTQISIRNIDNYVMIFQEKIIKPLECKDDDDNDDDDDDDDERI